MIIKNFLNEKEINFPFDKEKILQIKEKFPTPFHIYDEAGIKRNARRLLKAFSWAPFFKQYFAVKATPNPYILKILKKEGFGADCSSYPELLLAEKSDILGQDIMFTSNNTPYHEFKEAAERGAIINLDDLSHLAVLEKQTGVPETLCFRYNPGKLKKGNDIIGKPEEAKFGFTKEQLFLGYKKIKEMGVKNFGLHTMVVSNELNEDYFVETTEMLFNLIVELWQELEIKIDFVNLGGGIGIPYKLTDSEVNLENLGERIKMKYQQIIVANNLHPLKIFMECGRMVTGPYGYLITSVIHTKETYKSYLGTDATMANLMRPGIYGAYHHISVLGKENFPSAKIYDVIGSLCENNDKFAVDRELPEVSVGDILVIHDSGAHGHSMGFNYNGKLRSAELLLRENGVVIEIRRKEVISDYFATLNFSVFEKFQP